MNVHRDTDEVVSDCIPQRPVVQIHLNKKLQIILGTSNKTVSFFDLIAVRESDQPRRRFFARRLISWLKNSALRAE